MATVESLEQELDNDLENAEHYEIIDGERVELPPISAYSQIVASRLLARVSAHAISNQLGETVMETMFHLALPLDRNRRPDVAFVSYERWPKGKPQSRRGNAWEVVPDLAVEVISPTDFAEEILAKVDEYLRAGTRLVWVVFPCHRVVHVYAAFTAIEVVTQSESLHGGDVMPGFELALSELFTEELI